MNRVIIEDIIDKTRDTSLLWNRYSDSQCIDCENKEDGGYILCMYDKPEGKVIAIGITDNWGIINQELEVDSKDPCFMALLTEYERISKGAVLEKC